MSHYFNIIFQPSGKPPLKPFPIKKVWVLFTCITFLGLGGAGYYLFFFHRLEEHQAASGHRRKLAKENLKLTKRILALRESNQKYSEKLWALERQTRKTMNMANIDLNRVTNKYRQNAEYPLDPKNKGGVERLLFQRIQNLNNRYNRLFSQIKQKIHKMEQFPTSLPVTHKSFIAREFGKVRDPFSGKPSYHTGVDFSGVLGDSIFSPGSGVVKSIHSDPFYGKTMRISHNEHTETFYAHLQSILVSPGSPVRRGTLIGTIGNSGKTTGPHLHYEILVKGEKINPVDIYLTTPYQPFLSQIQRKL